MKKVLILGGTGFVGRSVCARLAKTGGDWSMTVPSRHPSTANHLRVLSSLQLVEADVHDPVQLAALVKGHDAVVNLVAILHGSEAQFRRAHVDLLRSLVAACDATDVRRLVHVSALGSDSAEPSRYLASKYQGEAIVRSSGLDWTILRPSVIYGEHDHFLNLFARLARFAPVFPLASADAKFQPVWVEDVASAIVACLDRPQGAAQTTSRQTYELAGPQQFTLGQLVRLAGRWSGHERSVIPLPAFLGKLQAGAMEWLPGEPLMSRDNLQSMRTPNVASGSWPSLKDLGIEAASLNVVGPSYLGRTTRSARH